jgi:hypothetical protein
MPIEPENRDRPTSWRGSVSLSTFKKDRMFVTDFSR